MTETPALVDTSILVYLFDLDDPEKRMVAQELVRSCLSGNESLAVSVQNLAEFAVVMTEKVGHPVPREVVGRFIRDIMALSCWQVIGYDGNCIADAIGIAGDTGLHYWDALLAATMKRHGVTRIYTEDAHFRRVPALQVINPFVR